MKGIKSCIQDANIVIFFLLGNTSQQTSEIQYPFMIAPSLFMSINQPFGELLTEGFFFLLSKAEDQ